MHRAVEARQPDGVRLIVDLGVDINVMVPGTGYDRSPLHNAAVYGDLDMVTLLLELGADPQLRDYPFGGTAIGWARYGQHENVVAYLAARGNDFDAFRCDGVERVAELLRQDLRSQGEGRRRAARFLRASGAGPARRDARILVAHGVPLNTRNEDGMTLVDRAQARGWIDFADVLRRHGARSGGELTAAA